MTRQTILHKHPVSNQRGAALIVSLVLLLVLSLLGVSSMQSTVMEERMAGNMYDRNLAFQAAEAALRAGEIDIFNGTSESSYYDVISAPAPTGLNDDANWPSAAIEYTGELAGLGDEPEFIIERQESLPPLEADQPLQPPLMVVTARGTGRNGSSVVVLQSVYKP